MDISKEYIEMCSKAQEIQDLAKDRIKNINICFDDVFASNLNNNLIVWGLHKKVFEGYLNEYIWLPRQDQLQGLFYNDLIDYNDKSLLNKCILISSFSIMVNHLSAFNTASSVDIFNWIDSFEKLWLIFIMRNVNNKIYKDNNWIKIKDKDCWLEEMV